MKKVYIIFLIFIAVLIVSFDFRNYNKIMILAAKSPARLIVDLNKNSQIDDNETASVKGIKDFEYDNQVISNSKTLYLNYLFSRWAKTNIINKFIDAKVETSDNKITLSDNDYAVDVLQESFALPTDESYKKYFSLSNLNIKLEPVSKNKLVLINKYNRKFHKLDCKYARKAHNFEIIPIQTAKEQGFKPCNYCYSRYKKFEQINFNKFVPPFSSKNFGNIVIFFIDSSNTVKPDNSCSQIACKTLLKEINSAKKSIDIAIYGIEDQPKLLNAIINAQNRGVKIRLVTDVDEKGTSYYKDNSELIKIIKNNITDSCSSPRYIMHNKFLIFDNSKVWTGSSNLTSTDFSNFNTNYNILINEPEIVSAYINEFEALYGGKFHCKNNEKAQSQGAISAYFSPQDNIITEKIIPLINNSKSYVYIPVFYLTDKNMTNALIEAKKRGVDVKIIIDSTNAHAKYSVHKTLRNQGIPVKTENKAGKLHSKIIIIDDKYSVIGSMNFTKSGEKYNNENVIIINNPEVAKYLKSTFIYLWKSIPDKYLKIDPYAESKSSVGSCSDGIDNDFDGKIDKADKFCN